MKLDAHIRNMSDQSFSGKVEYQLFDPAQKLVSQADKSFSVGKGKARQTSLVLHVNHPELWEPDAPALYQLHVLVKDKKEMSSTDTDAVSESEASNLKEKTDSG